MKKLSLLSTLLFLFSTVVAQTTTFNVSGIHSYTVPTGITQIAVDAVGGKGGNNNNWPAGAYPSQGGWGGKVVCTLSVSAGQVLRIYVGGQGTAGTTTIGVGGFNGGANAGGFGTTYNGGGGGGASDIRFSPYALADRKVVAGGGGGAGLNYSGGDKEKGGNGGGLTAQTGFANGVANCGGGGAQTCCAAAGSGGTAGALGVGGAGGAGNAAGGGGGGYYGGGGGGINWCGGGGGSSYTDAVLCAGVTHTQGANTTGDGYVSITPLPPTVTSTTSSLSFVDTVGGTSPARVFPLTAFAMSSSPITFNTTSPNFQFSFNGSTWFSSAQTYSFTLPGFSNVPLYVRFLPTALTSYSGAITVSGGGLASTVSLPVSGMGVVACSGTPAVGTATAAPVYGVATTPFTLSVSSYEPTAAVSLQWQSSPNGVSGWTNIAGATEATYNFTGITASTYYRLNVTCGVSGLVSSSNVVKIDNFPNACIPDYGITCSGGTPMYVSIGAINGAVGTSFTDPASTCSQEYINNSATHFVSLYEGLSYTPTLNVTTTYYTAYAVQMWIDFNADGVFTSGETVGGLSVIPSSTPAVPITIPAGTAAGTYRMRLVGNYSGCCGGVAYPSIPACVTTSINYGQARDYTVRILSRPACGAPPAQPTGITATSTLFAINGSFTAAVPATDAYLVVMTTSSTPPSAPVDGVTYSVGTNALGGKIVSAGSSTSFSVSGLTDNTPYWFWVYSYATVCTGTAPAYRTVSPLSGMFTTAACGITGSKTIGSGGDYPTLAAAVTAINTLGLGPNTSLEVLPSYTGETFPVTISGTLLCASSSRRLTIRPHSSNATTKVVTASTASAMISLNGARFIDIDGRVGSAGSTKRMEFVNNSTSSLASTVEFINDASFNSVRHMSLRGAATSTTTSGVVAFRTSTGTSGNDYNTIDNCDIADAASNPVNCIYSSGTSGRENDFDTISNCNLSNFYFNSSLATCGIFLSTATSGWSITGNRIFQTASRPYTASSSASMHGISVSNTSGYGFQIKDNVIGFANSAGSGTLTMSTSAGASFRGITVSVGTVTPTVIQNNTISGINFSTTTTTTNNCNMIEVSFGSATVSGNTIGSQTLTNAVTRLISSNGSIGVRGIYVTSSTPANVTLSNNTIGGFNLQGSSTAVGTGMYGIDISSTAGMTITGNIIGSTTTANSISTSVSTTGSPLIYGINCSVSSSTHQNPVVTGNTIANISSTCTGSSARFAGLVFNNSSSPVISQNVVRDISFASTYTAVSTDIALVGIMYTGSTGTAQISQNTINALALTNTASVSNNVAGILYSYSLDGTITRNRIYDLRNASVLNSPTSPPRAIGVFIYAPSTSVTIANNMIALGNGQTTNTAFAGIMAGVNSSYNLRAYHNSVSISGTVTTGSNLSTCFDRSMFNGSSNTAVTVDVRNNLFSNTRTGGTGIHYAISNTINGTSSTTGWAAVNCNYNILNAANAAAMGYWTGQRTMATWRSSNGNCDINSYTATPVTFTNIATGDLHINMGTTSNDIESHGNLIAGVTSDFDGHTRPGPAGSVNGGGGAPDIGADEFDGVPNDNIPPVITYTPNTCGNNIDLVFTATIADPAGVATGAVAPRVYYRKNAAAFTLANSAAGVLTSGTVQNGVWTFTVSASALGGLVAGNTVSYFVIAQDVNSFVGSNTQAGMTAANVNSISVYPTNPTTYTVGLGGTYTVGTAGNYTTITSAVAGYNGAACLSGPVVFELISPTYASESFPITINNHTWANATNTLTIRPAAGVAATVTGSPAFVSMFRLFNARYVTLDGVNSGGRSLTLNNTYTSTSANIMLSSSGYGSGCRNISLKNMNMNGGTNTSSAVYGIVAIGNTTTPGFSAGYDNDTITIEGNTITKCYYGIFCYQTGYTSTLGGNTDWMIRNNIIGPATYDATNNIGANGMYLYGLINPVITGNTVRNVGLTTTSLQAMGIYIPSICYGFRIDSNIITGITSLSSNTSTSSNAGLYIGSSVGSGSITRNTIQDIWNAQTGTSSARGMLFSAPGSIANILVANNMISNIRHSGSSTSTTAGAVGISLESTYGYMRFYNNSVLLDGTTGGNAATFSACFYATSGSNNIDVRDNIFVNKYNSAASTTDKGYAFYTTSSNTIFNELNYNNYYVSTNNVTAYTSGDRVGLAAFQTAYGRNANSREVDASFVSSTNLRLTSTFGNTAFASGTPIAEVPIDIDGTSRSHTNPVMGVHEVAFCSSITAGTVNPAVATLCGSGTTTITATGATAGETMQWRSSTDSVNWVTISGANSASYVIPTAITTTTWYRFVNKCSSSSISDSAVTKVVVNPLPDVITGTQTYCPGGTATLSSTAAPGTWNSSNTTTATINVTSGLVTANAAGTSTVSFTLTGTGCIRTTVITVNALPTVSGVTAASGIVCVGGNVALTAGSTSGTGSLQSYNWSGPSSYSTTTAAGSVNRTTSAVADDGTYSLSVTYTGAGCTSAPVTVPVTVNALPTIGSITASSATLCTGATLTLNAASATGGSTLVSYNWSGPNAFSTSTTSAATNLTVSPSSSGEYSVSVTYTGTGCTSSMAKTDPDVTVNALPTLTSVTAANDVVCVGTDIALTANGASGTGSVVSYNWSGPAAYSTSTAAATVNRATTTTAHSGAYSVTVTYAGTGCTSALVQKSVTVNSIPTVSGVTVASGIVCVGGDIALTAGTTAGTGSLVSYNWSGPSSYNTTSTATSINRTTGAVADGGTYSLTVTYTGAGCTSTPATVPVTVNAVPTLGSITTSSTTLCTGATLTINAVSATGGSTLQSYNWSGPNAFSTSTTSATTNLTVSPASSGEYSVSVTYTGTGCTSGLATTDPDVTVNALPTLTSVTAANDVVCVGTDVALTANGATGTGSLVSYNWSGPAAYSTSTTAASVNRTTSATSQSGAYSVSVTYAGTGCTSSMVQQAVTVNALPTLTGITASPNPICQNSVLTLTANGTSGTGSVVSYQWSGPAGYSTSTTGASQTYTVPATTASGAYSVSVTYTGAGCTSITHGSGAATVNPAPTAYNLTGGGTYCAGESGVTIDLSNSQPGVDYQLYNGATLIGSPVTGIGMPVSFGLQTMAGTYTVLATNTSTSCTAPMTGSTFISISAVPSIYTVTGGGIYCQGTTAPHIGVSSSDISVSYQLYRDGNPVGGLVTGDGNPIDFGTQTVSGNYTVIANPGSSCARTMTGTRTVTMHPAPSVYDVSGGGTICAGDAGQHVYLSWSVTGINYQLYRGSTAVGSPVAGAMAGLDMGVMNVAGTYTVRATNASTACGSDMNGSATIIVNPAPTVRTVTGGGVACDGENTVMVGLDGTNTNITYQLYRGAVMVGSPVAGTGAAISFGPQNVSGVYTVMATNTITTCSGNMSGSATVSINPAPVSYNVTGGGTYCAGGSGYTIGMANTNVGIFYQLYRGAITVGGPVPGTGAAISFGTFTATGTYTVLATNMLTSCSGAMSGSAVISINPNPSVYTVTGGGAYCAGGSGVPVGLSFSSSAINYQLYNGSSMVGAAIPGNGSTLSFGNQLAVGTYSVRATNPVTGCAVDMTGSATVVQNPLPALVTVTGGGSYCAGSGGMPVGTSGSQTGISYQLYRGSVPVGSAMIGNGSALSYGNQTTDGVYTVMATNTSTTCARGMSGSATIVTNPLPTQYTVAGGGHYCAGSSGVEITLNGSNNGINYQLYNGSTAIGSAMPGNGFALSFGLHTLVGTYSVAATNTSTTCANSMSGTVSVVQDPLPTAYNVTGGGAACAGSAGVPVSLNNSITGISYQLYNGATPMGAAVAGTGSSISFGNQTVTGTYTVLATNLSTLCTNAMTGSAGVTINALPAQYNVTGGGTYCENGSGVTVSLAGSQSGINYQLYNGSTAMGSPVAGTGAAISFGSQTLAGTYTVLATNATTSCTRAMTSSASVIMSPAPVAHNVTGGGGYCIGGSGVNVGLGNSTIGISYQLYRGATAVGGIVAGTGNAINFGLQTVAGTYTVLATNTITTCTNAMNGSAVVVINPLPVAYNISGGGSYCIGGTGVAIGVANTQTGVNYQLYRGATLVGTPVAGTGSAISFGLQTIAGNYTVQATNATTGCVKAMNGFASVVVNPLPVVYNVTGGGVYCAGGPGSHVGIESSEPGVNYQMYLGASAIGAPVMGSGASVDFGEVFVVGTYSAVATNAATGCSSPMSGSATVGVSTPPVAYNVTGGGSYCAGGAGINVGLSNSATGISYTLYRGTSAVGVPLVGTGTSLSFGLQTVAGSYSVRATNSAGCATGMTGTATVIVNPVPASFAVTGGGSYCPGAGGVNIGLTGSGIGISYQLYIGSTPVGSAITGTGAVLAMGTYTTVGTYSAVATASVSGCTTNMSGTASVSQYTLPSVYSMTGGGNYCSGGAGVTVGLNGSQSGVSYTLYRGASVVGTYAGTGSALNFGTHTTAGSYSVSATNTTTGCVSNMTGASVIGVNSLPVVYLTTGGGNYCAGGAGFAVVLNGSNTGINYELYRNGTATGATMAGTGTVLDFGLQTIAGMYTVKAIDAATGCIRTMAGSPEVIVHSLPVAHTVAGGGSYCAGGSGVEVSLANSSTGVSYQLYNGSTPIGTAVSGTGSTLSLGMQTAAGTYTVQALNAATGCTNAMTGSATVSIIALPSAFAVTGGGGYCAGGNGVAVGLVNTQTGVSYQLYRNGFAVGTALSGSGAAISYGLFTAAGTYTVRATAGSGCSNNMTGSATININPTPTVFNVGGGGSYCAGEAGVAVNVNGSQTGINYHLYNGGTATGASVTGTGGLVSFGPQTAGIYSVMAVNAATSCTAAMTGTVSVTANSLPVAWTVMGGGTFCEGTAGVDITLSSSDMNVNYALYNGTAATGTTLSGTGGSLSFGLHTTAGEYTVRATDMLTGCANNMNSSAAVSVNPAPARFAMTGGGNYCPGGSGVSVGLSGSEAGITYNLYRNGVATGATVTGTGGAVSFAMQTLTGNYTAMAVNTATGCNSSMNGAVAVGLHLAPTAYTVTGGGSYCNGGSGVSVALSGSASGVSYRLYNGATAMGTAIAGTGGALNFGMQTAAGAYTVLATNQTTGCSRAMSGNATVIVNALPAAAAVTGGGAYCSGGAGVPVGLAATQTGVTYRLYKGSVAIGTPAPGTGAAISFGSISGAGTYSVAASNATTGCAAGMSGTAVVVIHGLPAVQNVTGGGNYCAGGAGAEVVLSGSEVGINYQLYQSGSAVGTAVAGTGNILSMGMQTAAGTYTVLATNATTGCTKSMSGSVPVSVSALPVAQTVSGGGAYCAGGNGVVITLGGSQTGVTYKLYRGTTQVQTVAGTGTMLNLGTHTIAGMYTVMAINSSTSCTAAMSGSANVSVLPLPVTQSVGGGGSYCAGSAGAAVTLAGSETGVQYTLYNGSGVAMTTIAGSGEGISFGAQVTGTYTVRATNPVTGCMSNMLGSANITMNALPLAYNVTGGGGYCEGGTGVPVSLAGSQSGVTYELYQNGVATGNIKNGTGTSLAFGSQPVGVYSVVATSVATGCQRTMTGAATAYNYAQPTAFDVLGGGSYCADGTGLAVTLAGSQTGISYRLYRGVVAIGSAMAGNGSGLNFGFHTVSGDYTVKATNNLTGCMATMPGVASISINELPQAYTMTGGGSYCAGGAGVVVGLASSAEGISYQLYQGTTAMGDALAGTGDALDFGNQTSAGNYRIVATNDITGCTSAMASTVAVSVNALPQVYNLSANAAGYCVGSNGVLLTLNNSQTGVAYHLYNGAIASGGAVNGSNGNAISFGFKTAIGTYSVMAVNNATGCQSAMIGMPTIAVFELPSVYAVTGGGSYCAGADGVPVGLIGSQTGVNYQLYRGGVAVGSALAGTGASMTFGTQPAGIYTVRAQNATTGCRNNMSGTANAEMNTLPVAYNVTGGGTYCEGGEGMAIGLNNSATGISYQLYKGTTPVGLAVAGADAAISFGLQTAAGSYSVKATDLSTGCTASMTGNATIGINAAPAATSVTGGGALCVGGAGVTISLTGSVSGVSYRLHNGATSVGTSVAGTGGAISFAPVTGAGTYSVIATSMANGCTRAMEGTATVIVNALPKVAHVTGGGAYCAGGDGVPVGLDSSVNGINYTLYQGSTAVAMVSGTGSAITYGIHTGAGVYTVMATDAATGCVRNMGGSATISITPAVIPVVSLASSAPGAVCEGTLVTFTTTQTNGGTAPSYTWKVNGTTQASTTSSFGYIPANNDVVTVAMNSNAECALPSVATATQTMAVNARMMPVVHATVSVAGDTVCAGVPVTFTAVPEFGGATPVFEWVKNGSVSATGTEFTLVPENGDVIHVRMISNYECLLTGLANSENTTLSVLTPQAPMVTVTVDPGTIVAKGQTVTFTANAVNTYQPAYQWFVNGVAVHNATSATYTTATVEDNDTVACRVTNVTPCGEYASIGSVRMRINEVAVHTVAAAMDVRVMPNPTRGHLVITGNMASATNKQLHVEVTNMLGQVVYSAVTEVRNGRVEATLDLSGELANGMYLLNLRTDSETRVFHVTLQR